MPRSGQGVSSDPAALQECLSEIVSAAQRASHLSNQMLAYAGKILHRATTHRPQRPRP